MYSAASPTAIPSDAARFKAPDKPPVRISVTLMPALPRSLIASAESVALYTVLAPASMAAARSWSICALVAPVFAWTVLICRSKSAAIFTAATPNAATASPAVVIPLAISADLRPVFSMPDATVFAVLPARVIAASYEAVSAINRMTMFLFSAKASSKMSGQMRHQSVRGRIVPAIRISPLFHGLLHVRRGPADAGFGVHGQLGLRVLADRARQTAHGAQ